jgi:hypothetical protein
MGAPKLLLAPVALDALVQRDQAQRLFECEATIQ